MKSEVYNIDCLEYMRGLPDKHFDLVIADPPYGLKRFERECKEEIKAANGKIIKQLTLF